MVPSVHSTPLNEEPEKVANRASRAVLSGSSSKGEAICTSFFFLSIPTFFAIAVLIADARQIAFTGKIYNVLQENRASASIAIQVISVGLSFVQVAAVSRLFSFVTRMRLRKEPTPLSVLQLWNGVSLATIQWSLKPKLLALLCIYVGLAAVPGAIWTGSLTPVVTSIRQAATVRIPQYSNMSFLKEWPLEIAKSGPSLRNEKGFFTYSIGGLYGHLLTQSLTTATTTDGSPRHHIKYDNSQFMYIGRSFGVGSSVGIVDNVILQNPLTQSYQYQENGYATQISCRYNKSHNFFQISPAFVGEMLYTAKGYLPDSSGPESSVYVGHGTDAIVAFGVAANPVRMSSTRYLGIAAGRSYVNLNAIQCKLDFILSTFNVAVDINGKNITITRLLMAVDNRTVSAPAIDIESSGKLIHVAVRQIELYSNDLTNIYQSVAGNALNLSISDYRTFIQTNNVRNSNTTSPDSTTITRTGIENSITAMLDDILVAYASAQLTIADDLTEVSATVSLSAVRFGKSVYIYLIFGINTFVLLLVAEEAFRTKGWKNVPAFDYTDLAHLAIASSRGGTDMANAIENEVNDAGKNRIREKTKNKIKSPCWSEAYSRVKIVLNEKENEKGVYSVNLGVA